ncbi:zinc finger protein 580-like [Dasypus novemcinctus]|uniref:zinc finger protein 580-like n=1 Tax=Dasypus novemcinctus TaxID=9361 RepID=UPI0003290404|nr:zinc finger protein 580-like [Dasypus novemcinctus]
MDPFPPRVTSVSALASSSPSPAAPAAPQKDRHLLIDVNGVPYMYTVDEAPPPEPVPEPEPAKGFTCPQCLQVFKSALNLKNHSISHSELRPYICAICGKTFKNSGNLAMHRFIHL